MNDTQEFIALEQVCQRYGITRRQVMRLVDRGLFPPALRVGGLRSRIVRFRAADVQRWEEGSWQREGDMQALAAAVTDSVRPQDPRRRRVPAAAAAPAAARGAPTTSSRRSRAGR